MCGIAGLIKLEGAVDPREAAAVETMLDRLRHRGPDDRGVYRGEKVVLGNTRLKIIDLSDNAHLPMSNESGDVRLAYNGEVTNFRELEAEFRLREKYRFRSSSDTETLLHLYEELGLGFFTRLSGMFALCLYDRRAEKAWIARDFYGMRPLFYMAGRGRLWFGSEIKAFLELPGFEGRLDAGALHDYFSLAYIPGEATPFEEVREVRAGELIEADLRAGRWSARRYHELRYDVDETMEEAPAAARLREAMRDAVRRNLISDAPLGLTLSGGVDTACLLALADELGAARRMHTYSIRMAEQSFDESRFQKVLVDRYKPLHHEISVGPSDVEEFLEEHMAFLDEPTGDGAAVPNYLLAREAKKDVRVLLSGEGGDEVFNAYETHGAFKVRRLYRRLAPRLLRAALREAARRLPSSYKKLSLDFLLKRFTAGAEESVPKAHFYWRHVLSEEEKRRLLVRPGARPTDELFAEMFDALPYDDELNRLSHIDLTYYFVDDLMVKNDRMFMAHSVEARFPYADRLLVDFASRIPTRLKIKGFSRRHIQKRAMADLLPPAIVRRKNMGLEMPHSLWFLKELRPLAEKYFAKKSVEKSGLLHHAAVDALWKEHLAGARDNGRALWCVLMFLVWFDVFVHEKSYRRRLGAA
jgi:asparagine synthase (glutamine-hydrolysing)